MVKIPRERRIELEQGTASLNPHEKADGWHFCLEWDGMLVHPDDPEAQCCLCNLGTEKPLT
jgi:hypothetical protein